MFERFTAEARDVVVQAQLEARSLGHGWIGAEHLFLGALTHPDAPGMSAVVKLGVTTESFRPAVGELIGSGADELGPQDVEALGTLGIDLDEVRQRVEASFGPGALERAGQAGRRSKLPWRRSKCSEVRAGELPFTPRAKRALARGLHEALGRKDQHIGVAHLVLGLLDPHGNVAVDVLHRLGVSLEEVRSAVLAELDQAA